MWWRWQQRWVVHEEGSALARMMPVLAVEDSTAGAGEVV